ncbi:hypothetical protein [Roseivirga sp. E12]|uniref:hypothetical protein n=1 Tax=Roseivirga sp. E12 TaxID=2819237 RepID=UPI001ABC82F4|nr:hypothetical protein [Roseivirga sp. E12]MBO3700202.1 hypothetical protein [Roseivirga sp. E12]
MKNELLRHIISTIKYRFEKSVKGSHETFGDFSLSKGSRSAKEIVHHMNDVIYSTRFFIEHESMPQKGIEKLNFENEVERFKTELSRIDQLLNSNDLDVNYSKRLFQGPFSDVLTHIGQIAMLQRLADNPIAAEDFSRSAIKTGIND